MCMISQHCLYSKLWHIVFSVMHSTSSNLYKSFGATHSFHCDLFYGMLEPCTNEYSLYFLLELQLYCYKTAPMHILNETWM